MVSRESPRTDRELNPRERARADFRDTTLARLAHPFERLMYLASLRDFAVDEYVHWGMENVHGAAVTHAALAELHLEVFREVSLLPLAELAGQVRDYLARQKDGGQTLLRNWRTGLIGNYVLPPRVDDLEAANFRINIDTILDVITAEPAP